MDSKIKNQELSIDVDIFTINIPDKLLHLLSRVLSAITTLDCDFLFHPINVHASLDYSEILIVDGKSNVYKIKDHSSLLLANDELVGEKIINLRKFSKKQIALLSSFLFKLRYDKDISGRPYFILDESGLRAYDQFNKEIKINLEEKS